MTTSNVTAWRLQLINWTIIYSGMSNSNIVCLNLVSCNSYNIILTESSAHSSTKSIIYVLNYYVAYLPIYMNQLFRTISQIWPRVNCWDVLCMKSIQGEYLKKFFNKISWRLPLLVAIAWTSQLIWTKFWGD